MRDAGVGSNVVTQVHSKCTAGASSRRRGAWVSSVRRGLVSRESLRSTH